MPNLQAIKNKVVNYQHVHYGETITSNIYYEEDLNKIKAYMTNINKGLENKDKASELLIKFFEYYCYYFQSEQKISINKVPNETIKLTNSINYNKNENENAAFNIADRFDIHLNPGKSMILNSKQYNKFITAMKKELNFILNGEYIKRIENDTIECIK